MTEEAPKYRLKEKGEFSREQLEKDLTGKLVCIKGAGAEFSMTGILVSYESGNFAVLKPYLFIPNNKPIIVDEISIVENPIVVSRYDCDTFEEVFEKYIKPSIEARKKEQRKRSKK